MNLMKRIVAASIFMSFFVVTPCAIVIDSQAQSEIIEESIEAETLTPAPILTTLTIVDVETNEVLFTVTPTIAEAEKPQELEIQTESISIEAIPTVTPTPTSTPVPTSTSTPTPTVTIVEAKEDVSSSDLRYLSAIIWAEARGQCAAGQQAVGIVVMNRVESAEFKNTVYDVITSPHQFSPVSNGSFESGLNCYDNGEMDDSIIAAAEYALQGNKTVYYNNQTLDLSDCVYFSRSLNHPKFSIGDHVFSNKW
jgi:spore germination cell wall hydrolase CwlJ-like protein